MTIDRMDRISLSWTRSARASTFATLLLLAACGDDPVQPPDETGGNTDPSADTDSGEPDDGNTGTLDAGTKLDAGGKADSGTKSSDAGKAVDAKVAESDSGGAVSLDAGKGDAGKSDVGSDAAIPSTPDASASKDASADSSTPAADASTLPADPGKGNGLDVVTLGDSWMSNTLDFVEGTGGGIAPALVRAAGNNYPNYAVQGVMLLSDDAFGPAIPTQWTAALRAHPGIKTVVMTGGGNDIIQDTTLSNDCASGGSACDAELDKIGAALETLWQKMADGGVQDILYVEYAPNAGSGLKKAQENHERIKKICDEVKLPTRCHLVPTADITSTALAADGIHPLAAANTKVAARIVQVMKDEHVRR